MGIFIYIEALAGRHHVSVREHRTAIDWAEEIKYLVDVMYPDKEKFILVMDNLNTHRLLHCTRHSHPGKYDVS